MKKPDSKDDDLRPVYKREDLGQGVRGKYFVAYYLGDSDDFDEETAATRKNKRLMEFLDERGAKAKGRKGVSLDEVRRRLEGPEKQASE